MEEPGDFPAGRYERKYLVPDNVAVAIRNELLPHLDVDSHTPADSVRGYAVYSLYLDTPSLDLYRHTRQGLKDRFKLRIRYYDHDPDGAAYVEVKERSNGLVFKRRYRADRPLVEAMLRDPQCEPLVHALGNGARNSALDEFSKRRQSLGADPKLFVAYEREAYNSKSEPKVRITFDRRIIANAAARTAGLNIPRFGSNVGGLNVLIEFKHAGPPPAWLTDVLAQFKLRRGSFSKFAEGLDVLGLSGQDPRKHKVGSKK
jgi:hypothetical protein